MHRKNWRIAVMKKPLKSILICTFATYSISHSSAYAQDSAHDTTEIDGATYYTDYVYRLFPRYNENGEKFLIGSIAGSDGGFSNIGIDIEKTLSEDDKQKWQDELCYLYIYPECLKILNENKQNHTISLVLGLLNFSGIPHSNRFKATNFLDPDLKQARNLIEYAADSGLPEALNIRAVMKAIDWGSALRDELSDMPSLMEPDLKAAADKGYQPAMLNLAGLYMTMKRYEEAKLIFEELSNNGMAEANFALGVIYLTGHGAPRDLVKAREYFGKAAPVGRNSIYKEASYNLGMMYFYGHGGNIDYKLARRWVGNATSSSDKLDLAVAALPRIDQALRNEANSLNSIRAISADSRLKEIACPEEKISVPGNSTWRTDVDLVVVPYPSEIGPNQRRQWAQKIDIEQTFLSLFGGTSFSISCQFQSKSSVCADTISTTGYDPRAGKAEIFGQNILSEVQSGDFRIRDKSGRFFAVKNLDKIKTEYERPAGGTKLISDGLSQYMISYDFVRFDLRDRDYIEPTHFILSRSKAYYAFCKQENVYVPNF
jgi:TPR repeat protein